jgi:hypothetical protein
MKKLREAVAQIPLGIQPQDAFGGRDLAIAGYFRGRDLAQADWAVYGRANWAGSSPAAALEHPRPRRLDKRGLDRRDLEAAPGVTGRRASRARYSSRACRTS